MRSLFLISAVIILIFSASCMAGEEQSADSLAVLWTSGDPDVANKVCLIYTHAAKKYGWFETVHLIIWGPSAKLLAEDPLLQKKVKSMKEDGIRLVACVVCADSYNVSDKLRELGVDVIPMGKPLTGYLKRNWRTLTF